MGWLGETIGPEIITNVFKNNKATFIILGIILLLVLLLKWFQAMNKKMRGI